MSQKVSFFKKRGGLPIQDFHDTTFSIPRVTLYPSNSRLCFKFGRRQFPVRHAYVMTINKSQGQSLKRTGLYLPDVCFAHGQLYMAFSRCGYPPNDVSRTGLKIVVQDIVLQGVTAQYGGLRKNETQGIIITPNIVFKEIFE